MTYHATTRTGHLMLGAAIAMALTAGAVSADTIRFWTTEEQPERLAKQQEMAAQFEEIGRAHV